MRPKTFDQQLATKNYDVSDLGRAVRSKRFEMRCLELIFLAFWRIQGLKMDVDCELDSDLLTKFSCLGTTDRDVLINELQRLLDFQLNPSGCAFFLDMTNW